MFLGRDHEIECFGKGMTWNVKTNHKLIKIAFEIFISMPQRMWHGFWVKRSRVNALFNFKQSICLNLKW